jgi:hypothetical protein
MLTLDFYSVLLDLRSNAFAAYAPKYMKKLLAYLWYLLSYALSSWGK